MFGWRTLEQVRANYRDILKPGVDFRREELVSIDPTARRAETTSGVYEADLMVVALGAEYEMAATPGFEEGGSEFYSIDGALRLRELLPTFEGGRILISVLGEPFKCPPAPCEAAMLLDQCFRHRGKRDRVEIMVTSPWGRPIPPSPDGSKAILDRFAELGLTFMKETLVTGVDPATKTAQVREGDALPYDLFLGVPRHHVPAVVENSSLVENGWNPVSRDTLATKFEGVYTVGDVTSVATPKAGVFSENPQRS